MEDIVPHNLDSYFGNFSSEYEAAQYALECTGVVKAMEQIYHNLGYGMRRYVKLDVEEYILDMSTNFDTVPQRDGSINFYLQQEEQD